MKNIEISMHYMQRYQDKKEQKRLTFIKIIREYQNKVENSLEESKQKYEERNAQIINLSNQNVNNISDEFDHSIVNKSIFNWQNLKNEEFLNAVK